MGKEIMHVFERVEKKYMLTPEQEEEFLRRIEPYMQMDEYGLHTIQNLYFDTDADDLIYASLAKPVYKEKLRLRGYGRVGMNDMVFLEIKKKYKGIVYKRRVGMTLRESKNYLEHGIKPYDSQIMREMDYFLSRYPVKPKLYLAYDRRAYAGREDDTVRMTLDTNIRSRRDKLCLDVEDTGEYLLPDERYLLEIKVVDAYPGWLVAILSDMKLYPISFSKYGNIFMKEKKTQTKRSDDLCSQVS